MPANRAAQRALLGDAGQADDYPLVKTAYERRLYSVGHREIRQFRHALRQEFWGANTYGILAATIREGLRLGDDLDGPDGVLPYTGFAMIRAAYLFPNSDVDVPLAQEMLNGHLHLGPPGTDTCLTPTDVALARATANYLLWTPTWRPGMPRFVADIREVMAEPTIDRLVERESHILLARALLTVACMGRPWPWKSRTTWVRDLCTQAAGELSAAINLRSRVSAISLHDLKQALNASRDDPKAALAILRRERASQQETQQLAEPPMPEAPDGPALTGDLARLSTLVDRTTVLTGSRRRRNLNEALKVARSLNTHGMRIDEMVAFIGAAERALGVAIGVSGPDRPDSEPGGESWAELVFNAFPESQNGHGYPPEVALAFARFCRACTGKLTGDVGYPTRAAYEYLRESFDRASDGAPLTGELAVSTLAAGHSLFEMTFEPIDFLSLLDAIDRIYPPDDSARECSALMAACSGAMFSLATEDELLELADRCVRYSEESLDYLLSHDPAPLTLELAYRNAATARIAAYGSMEPHSTNSQSQLERALSYAREAIDVGVGSLASRGVYAHLLNLVAEEGGAPRAEAVAEQLGALESAFAGGNAGQQASAVEELVDNLFWVAPEEDALCSRLVMRAWETNATSPTASLRDCLSSAQEIVDNSGSLSTDAESARRVLHVVESAVSRLIPIVAHEDVIFVLTLIQGLTSVGAVAAAHLGQPDKALTLLEQGATLRVGWQTLTSVDRGIIRAEPISNGFRFKIRNFRPDREWKISVSSGVAIQDGHGTVRVVGPRPGERVKVGIGSHWDVSSAILDPRQLQALADELDNPIIYLTATEDTGLAVVVGPGRDTETIWLPSLTVSTAESWLTRLEDSTRESATRSQRSKGAVPLVRGPRGTGAPSPEAVDIVVQAAAEAIRSLADLVAGAQHVVHLVPIGLTAGIPWTATLSTIPQCGTTPATVCPSATLLGLASDREAAHGRPVAITAPDPCIDSHGQQLPSLPKAVEEGAYLSRHHGARHFTGKDARRDEFTTALQSNPRFLHLAVHGEIDHAKLLDHAHLIWAATPPAGSETTSVDDVAHSSTSCGLVFVAAGWGGLPNRVLPDESISFPSAFLIAGASTVIAPLWPIDDATAKAVAVRFYDSWAQGMPAAQALQHACAAVRKSKRHQNATWAAFSIIGPDLAYSSAPKAAWRSTPETRDDGTV